MSLGRSPLAYRPPAPGAQAFLQRAGATAALAYLGALTLTAFVFSNPLVLLGAGTAVVIAGIASGAGPALALTARFALPLGLVMVGVNVLVSDRGNTVLVRGFDLPVLGSLDVSLESIAAGGVIALRVVVVMAAFSVLSASVDPDALLRLLRPVARRSALTATLIARLVPLAAADHRRLSEAAELRGPTAAPVSRAALARRLVAGALDRSLDAAATLELRGFALPGRTSPASGARRRGSREVFVCAAAIALLAIGGAIAGIGGFTSYPSVEMDGGPADLALALAIALSAAMPLLFVRLRRPRGARAARPHREAAHA